MPVRISQPMYHSESVEVRPYGYAPGQTAVPDATPEPDKIPWARYVDALRRHVFLIAAIGTAGSLLGFVAARRVQAIYDVQSTVWIASGYSAQSGPIRPQQLLPSASWVELLRSYSIVEPVVRRLRLNVYYRVHADSVLFAKFQSMPTLRPGAYLLKTELTGQYTLSIAGGAIIERGILGDSIGRKVGFAWAPEARLFSKGHTLRFWVSTPRAAAIGLLSALRSSMPEDGQFLTITLSGSDPNRIATTLNEWVEEFVNASSDLKKVHLLEFKKILADQLSVAENQLRGSEAQLERFRENTITLPSMTVPIAGAADQSVGGYFMQKSALAEVQNERVAIEQVVAKARGGPLNSEAFLMIPALLTNTPQLRAAIEELSSRQAALRTEQQFLTDANPRIKQLNESIRVIHALAVIVAICLLVQITEQVKRFHAHVGSV